MRACTPFGKYERVRESLAQSKVQANDGDDDDLWKYSRSIKRTRVGVDETIVMDDYWKSWFSTKNSNAIFYFCKTKTQKQEKHY